MPFNLELVGRRYEAPEEVVDRPRHQLYAAAVGADPGPPGTLRERPLACFAAVYLLRPLVELLFGDRELGLDLAHLLHGEQEFCFRRALAFGDRLRPEGEIAAAERRRGLLFLDFRCRGRERGGEAAVEARSLFVVREQA